MSEPEYVEGVIAYHKRVCETYDISYVEPDNDELTKLYAVVNDTFDEYASKSSVGVSDKNNLLNAMTSLALIMGKIEALVPESEFQRMQNAMTKGFMQAVPEMSSDACKTLKAGFPAFMDVLKEYNKIIDYQN